jgi:hypothetical protein
VGGKVRNGAHPSHPCPVPGAAPAVRSGRSRPSRSRRVLLAAGALLLVGLVAFAFEPGSTVELVAYPVAPSSSPNTTDSGEVKYYVVGTGADGQREFLFDIAARTLGDGNRYMEIFNLNTGRLQPDGRRLTDPAVVRPGWVLQLPDDAQGPAVKVGVLPESTAGPATVIRDTTGPGPASDSAWDRVSGWIGYAAIVLVLVVAIGLLVRGKQIGVSRRPSLAHAGPSAGVPLRPVPHRQARSVPARPDTDVRVSPAATRTAAESAEPAQAPETRRSPSPQQTPDVASGRLIAAGDPTTATLETNLTSGPDRLAIRLVGARGPAGAPFAWYGSATSPTTTASTVHIGDTDRGPLLIDLALSPDVIRITGSAAGVSRSMRSIVSQLGSAGVPVTFVRGVPGALEQARLAPGLDDVVRSSPAAAVQAVIVGPPREDELPTLQRLVGAQQPRTVVLVVGDGPNARWSIHVTAADTDRERSRSPAAA